MATIVHFFNKSPVQLGQMIARNLLCARKFREHGHRYVYVLFSSEFDDQLSRLKDVGLEVEIIPGEHTRGWKLARYLRKYIIDNDVKVVFLNFIKPFVAVMLILLTKANRRNVAFVYTKHSPGRLISSKWNPQKHLNPLSVMSWFVDRVVGVSESIASNIVNRGVNPKKLVKIYNGTCLEIHEQAINKGRIRRELGIPDDHKIISTIKDARPEVGLGDLLHSIRKVLPRFPNTMFLIVGGGVEEENLKALAGRLGIHENVRFLGIRRDIPDIIAESCFTVAPSPVEAFGIVIIESMAGKKPVVAVDNWGPREIIANGETGILVDKTSPIDFSGAIEHLLSNPEKVREMGEKGYERVKRDFSIEKNVEETVKLALECMKHTHPPGVPPSR